MVTHRHTHTCTHVPMTWQVMRPTAWALKDISLAGYEPKKGSSGYGPNRDSVPTGYEPNRDSSPTGYEPNRL